MRSNPCKSIMEKEYIKIYKKFTCYLSKQRKDKGETSYVLMLLIYCYPKIVIGNQSYKPKALRITTQYVCVCCVKNILLFGMPYAEVPTEVTYLPMWVI